MEEAKILSNAPNWSFSPFPRTFRIEVSARRAKPILQNDNQLQAPLQFYQRDKPRAPVGALSHSDSVDALVNAPDPFATVDVHEYLEC